jgi:23S rRNA pseudouridine2604 synthase
MSDTKSYAKIYEGPEPQRLNKWMAQSGICSRREAESLIEQGLIFVDEIKIIDLGHKIAPGQTLRLAQAGQARLETQMTIIYHKPVGIVSGQPEPGETPAVRMIIRSRHFGPVSLVPDQNSKLAPIGRLDKDSRGLLILSEDGVLAKAIIGPTSDLEKDYEVRVRGEITPAKIARLQHGLALDGRQLKPAKITLMKDGRLRFILKEGRNRQIRRMCELLGLEVVDLKRTRIGPLSLEPLPEGQWRLLTAQERLNFKANP